MSSAGEPAPINGRMAVTLYEWLDVPQDVEPEMVGVAAMLGGASPSPARAGALAVLSDAGARADYDARADRGLLYELLLAWGVSAAAAGRLADASGFYRKALAVAPDNRAVPLLLAAVDAPGEPASASPEARAAARAEIERLLHNSAFPHRLVRFLTALAAEELDASAIEAALDLLERDMADAPRAYAMVLPVLREHYPAAFALNASFFEASEAVLARHAPSAEYERGKRSTPRPPEPHREDLSLPPPPISVRVPRLRVPERRLNVRFTARHIPWLSAAAGAVVGLKGGAAGAITGAALGWFLGYVYGRPRLR